MYQYKHSDKCRIYIISVTAYLNRPCCINLEVHFLKLL